MKFTTIIFDMDGTIVQTEHFWKEATKQVITRRGLAITPDLDEYLSSHFVGLSLPRTCAIIKDLTKSDDSVETIMKEKSELAQSLYCNIELIPGFESFHAQVIAASCKT